MKTLAMMSLKIYHGNKYLPVAFLLVLTLAFTTAKADGERRVSLRGNWKFTLGDNKKFAQPEFDDERWEPIYVPASWQQEGFRRYHGYAWYRNSFEIEFNGKETLYLQLGRVDDTDEVYINGKLIGTTGGFPPNYFTAWNVERIYFIPAEYLVKGKKNVIAVRVYDEGGEGGILGRSPGIYAYDGKQESGFSLAGNWKFHLFDDKSWAQPGLKDDDWENVVVPASWESQGFQRYDGFAWYRKRFTLPAEFNTSDLVALLGKIDDMDEVYLNGKLIGATGNIESRWARNEEWQKPRTYLIPDGLLKAGQENVIAVRVYDQEQNGGIFEGPIAIIAKDKYREFWKRYRSEHGYYEYHSIWSWLNWNE